MGHDHLTDFERKTLEMPREELQAICPHTYGSISRADGSKYCTHCWTIVKPSTHPV
jgi:hypothetical protein